MTAKDKPIERLYCQAKDRYAEIGVDTDAAIEQLGQIPISMHCWQGDDIGGFETPDAKLSGGGIMTTGNYPGRARNADELRADIEKALSLIPGKHRLNLHAIYAETGGKKVARNELTAAHFSDWVDWAKAHIAGIDFNGTFFSHPKADSGFTLASRDEGIRKFWVEHGIACRKIGESIGKALGNPCVTNVWIPDGYKDIPVDRKTPRLILRRSLDEIFDEEINPQYNLDAVECKLFGIGSESYVVGSHEFYLGYAIENKKMLCLDSGHFHPTEVISDKISSVLAFLDKILLHVSRGVRWDSDHVVIFSDELRAIAQEIVRGDFLDRVQVGLDFFDASINRIAAWVIGARSIIRAFLFALLEPNDILRGFETNGDYTSRLALLEEIKTLPAPAVWDYYCCLKNVPIGISWMDEVRAYERDCLALRQ